MQVHQHKDAMDYKELRNPSQPADTPDGFVSEIRSIIDQARSNAVRSVDFCRVRMYWNIGKRIFEEEQHGKERADYGTYLIRNLAKRLEPEYGSGFSVRQLERSRQFYRLYPIASTVRTQLNWSQYKMLIAIADADKREYYELEAINNSWTGRELERQINSMLYERLLLSNDKEAVLAVARKERIPESPMEIIKDPMVLEFLGLERQPAYYEKDLEKAIITHIADFLLEMLCKGLHKSSNRNCCILLIMAFSNLDSEYTASGFRPRNSNVMGFLMMSDGLPIVCPSFANRITSSLLRLKANLS